MKSLAAIMIAFLLVLIQGGIGDAYASGGGAHAHVHAPAPKASYTNSVRYKAQILPVQLAIPAFAYGNEPIGRGIELRDAPFQCPVNGSVDADDCCSGSCSAGATLQALSYSLFAPNFLPMASERIDHFQGTLPPLIERPPRS